MCNIVYEQVFPNPPGSLVRRIQEKLMDWTSFSLPLIWGKWGFFPLRRAVTTIIGHPIDVPHIKNPTLEQVLTVHARYVERLQSMYDAYKDVVELTPIAGTSFLFLCFTMTDIYTHARLPQ
jgi:2-acylglycerol O-acyltransferase 2